MPIAAGTRIGSFEIVALLGAGGMGEVYRARDPRLKRDVAIKVLAHAGTDPAQHRPLLDEAQAASALNHPNIVTVYDVGTENGVPYVVSELVEGTSLRTLASRAPLPAREVLDLAVQMADGLAAAHQAGIVHRDFKPENVMVTRDGRVKILDFGLALVGRSDLAAADAETISQAGMLLVGTVPYMSPEQARGATVDFRTDQFSLGLTLYELVTGRRAFRAETAVQVLAAILDDEAEPIAKINPKVPAPVRWAIERCLAKDARQRYHATADLVAELRTLRDRVAEFAPPIDIAPPPSRRPRQTVLAIAALVATAAMGVIVGLVSRNGDAGLDQYRYTPFATDAGYQGSPAWSPDGKTLAFVADVDGVLQVFTRALASSLRQQVTHSRFDCREPFWSPDGSRLYYIALARDRDGLWSISSVGGEPELVMENVSRATLSPDGQTLAFFRAAENNLVGLLELWLSSPPGSPPVQYTRGPFGGARPGVNESTLHFSPDGSKLGAWLNQWGNDPDLQRAQPEFWVLPIGTAAPYMAPPLPADLPVAGAFSWLPDSRRVVSALPHPEPGVHLWLTDTEQAAPRLLTMTGHAENDPAVSPDGTRLAMTFQQADYDLYRFTVGQPQPSVLLATSRNEMDPAWSPAGDQMAFTTDRTGHEEIWLRSQTGDWERPLVTPQDFGPGESYSLSAAAFAPDGQRIAYFRRNRIWITPVAGGLPVPLAPGNEGQDWPAWSPDGGWIAYVQGERGRWSLAKIRVGAKPPPEVLARDIMANSRVQWAPNGAWIAYNSRSGLSVVSPDGQSTRVVQEQPWLAFTWSADSRWLYGIRQSDDFKHLTFAAIDIDSRAERVFSADFMPLPVAAQPVRGFTRASPTTFVASIARVRSDVWLLEGFEPPPTLWDRLASFVPFRNR